MLRRKRPRAKVNFSIHISHVEAPMPNRKPTNVLELSGSFKHNPNRRRADPPPAGEIGEAPDHLADDEKNLWKELVAQSPLGVLQASDRAALEIVCCLMAEFRNDRASFTPAKIGVLQRALSSLGHTPVDRSRLGVSKQESSADDPWADFAKAQ